LQACEKLGFLVGRPRRHLRLAMPRPRLIKGDARGMPGLALLGGGIELDEYLTALHVPAEDRVSSHHPAGDRRLHGMGSLAHFQARGVADGIQRHFSAEEPGSPGAEEPDDEEHSQGRASKAVSIESALCGSKHGGRAPQAKGISEL
jgi:hypothetical protein